MNKFKCNAFSEFAIKITIWQLQGSRLWVPILEFISTDPDEPELIISNSYRLVAKFDDHEFAAEYIYQQLIGMGAHVFFPKGYEFGEFDYFEWDDELGSHTAKPKRMRVMIDMSDSYEGTMHYVSGNTTRH